MGKNRNIENLIATERLRLAKKNEEALAILLSDVDYIRENGKDLVLTVLKKKVIPNKLREKLNLFSSIKSSISSKFNKDLPSAPAKRKMRSVDYLAYMQTYTPVLISFLKPILMGMIFKRAKSVLLNTFLSLLPFRGRRKRKR